MATPVLMPKLGQTVESCIIVEWKKRTGDSVGEGEPLCEVETDKALMEVESPVAGTLLALFFQEGDEVPVMTPIAAVGEPGEDAGSLPPAAATAVPGAEKAPAAEVEPSRAEGAGFKPARTPAAAAAAVPAPTPAPAAIPVGISPRARNLAARKGLDTIGLQGTGPGGRIIDRDVQAALAARPPLTRLAAGMAAEGGRTVPAQGTGIGGRVVAGDLVAAAARPAVAPGAGLKPAPTPDEVETIPVKGVRKVIAERMLSSVQTTAQLTLNASADARELLAYRKRLKNSDEAWGLQQVTINDLILFAVSRMLLHYPELNALFTDNAIHRYTRAVHLSFAVDTLRGLMVPVIRNAQALSLQQLAQESKRLASACLEGTVTPDELSGGTFTVTNLGSLGVETFTPILNPPQVGILGVGNVNLKPVEVDGEVQFVPHMGLSLTINHQVVDGAPAARFLQALCRGLAEIGLLLAL